MGCSLRNCESDNKCVFIPLCNTAVCGIVCAVVDPLFTGCGMFYGTAGCIVEPEIGLVSRSRSMRCGINIFLTGGYGNLVGAGCVVYVELGINCKICLAETFTG